MSFSDIYMITDSPVISGVIWFVILTIIFYLARNHAHRAIISISRILHNAMRVSAHSVMLAEKKMIQRNTEVLLAQGREASERMVEREFERVLFLIFIFDSNSVHFTYFIPRIVRD